MVDINTSIQTNKYFPNKTNTKKYIMLHHTASLAPDVNQVNYLAKSPAEVSCHYVIGLTGDIYQIANDSRCPRHAGTGSYGGIINEMNYHSIGIEVCSDGHIFNNKQRENTDALIKELMDRYNIPHTNVIRHLDYTSRKWDIGDKRRNKYFASYEDYQNSFISGSNMNEEKIKAALKASNTMYWDLFDSMDGDYKEVQDHLAAINNILRDS